MNRAEELSSLMAESSRTGVPVERLREIRAASPTPLVTDLNFAFPFRTESIFRPQIGRASCRERV